MTDYVTIKLPRKIVNEIDPIIENKGYASRAEFVKEAIRKHIADISVEKRSVTQRSTSSPIFSEAKQDVLAFLEKLKTHPNRKSWVSALSKDPVTVLATKLGYPEAVIRHVVKYESIQEKLEEVSA